MTKLAVSISGENLPQMQERLIAAKEAGAEMVELRTDSLPILTTDAVKQLTTEANKAGLPIILTCRGKEEGGVCDWPLQLRVKVLVEACQAGADYVDLEYQGLRESDVKSALMAAAQENHTRVIVSAHNFDGPFEDISLLYDNIRALVPEGIPKIVYRANHINECFSAFDLLHGLEEEAIVLCMGAAAQITRILAKKMGAFLTFASLDDDTATAPGQLSIRRMRELYRWDAIDSETELFGVIGDPVEHSLGPHIFNRCFTKSNLNAVYMHLLVEDGQEAFSEFVKNAAVRDWLHFRGFSVTLPHKVHALDHAKGDGDYVDDVASTIGAVNTLKVGYGGIVSGYNTDCIGAMTALTAAMGIDKHELHGRKVAVLGAGGVARAVVAGLCEVGADVTIYNRTHAKAEALAGEFQCHYETMEDIRGLDAEVVVNCTSIGMAPKTGASPLPEEVLRKDMIVFDTVYTPMETMLLSQARQKGAQVISGVEMFIQQALAQFGIYTGQEPGSQIEEIMRRGVVEAMSSQGMG